MKNYKKTKKHLYKKHNLTKKNKKNNTKRFRNKRGGSDLIDNYNSMSLQYAIQHFNDLFNDKCKNITQINNKMLYISIEDDTPEYKKLCLNIMQKNEPIDETMQMITRSKRKQPEYEYINQCISSIELGLDGDENGIIIDSKTQDEFQKRNLNTLLRCLVILLGKKIAPEKNYILSYPMNYLSAYSLITKFNGIAYNAMTNKPIDISKLKSVEDYKNYYANTPMPDYIFEEDYIGPIDEVRVQFNYYNLNNAYYILKQTLSKFSCDILEL
jgi:hypothetical protein